MDRAMKICFMAFKPRKALMVREFACIQAQVFPDSYLKNVSLVKPYVDLLEQHVVLKKRRDVIDYVASDIYTLCGFESSPANAFRDDFFLSLTFPTKAYLKFCGEQKLPIPFPFNETNNDEDICEDTPQSRKQRKTDLTIIYALKDLLVGKDGLYQTNEELVQFLSKSYSGFFGMSDHNIKKRFAEANKIYDEQLNS